MSQNIVSLTCGRNGGIDIWNDIFRSILWLFWALKLCLRDFFGANVALLNNSVRQRTKAPQPCMAKYLNIKFLMQFFFCNLCKPLSFQPLCTLLKEIIFCGRVPLSQDHCKRMSKLNWAFMPFIPPPWGLSLGAEICLGRTQTTLFSRWFDLKSYQIRGVTFYFVLCGPSGALNIARVANSCPESGRLSRC